MKYLGFLWSLYFLGGIEGLAVRYNQIFQKSSHNSYVRDEALLDQLIYHRVHSLEFDIHRTKKSWATRAGDWYVYHNRREHQTTCHRLSDCLSELRVYHDLFPQHPVVTVSLDLKDRLDLEGHRGEDLDGLIRRYLAGSIWTPGDLLKSCAGASSLVEGVGQCKWPRLRELRGKFIFALTGGDLCSDSNVRSYGFSRESLGFLMPDFRKGCGYLHEVNRNTIFYNFENGDNYEFTRAIHDFGLVSRVWDLNNKSDYFRAIDGRVNLLATNKVNFHADTWTRVHQSNGWPFVCFGECVGGGYAGPVIMRAVVNSGDIWDRADDFLFAYRALKEEAASLSAVLIGAGSHVTEWAKACVMARAGLGARSPYLAMCRPNRHSLRAQLRVAHGGKTIGVEVPVLGDDTVDPESLTQVKLSVRGRCVWAYGSHDGRVWRLFRKHCFSRDLLLGFAVSSHGGGEERFLFVRPTLEEGGVSREVWLDDLTVRKVGAVRRFEMSEVWRGE